MAFAGSCCELTWKREHGRQRTRRRYAPAAAAAAASSPEKESLPASTALNYARSWREIAEVSVSRRRELRDAHFSVALLRVAKHLAKYTDERKRQEAIASDAVQSLVGLAFAHVGGLSARHLTDVVWACGILGTSPGDDALAEVSRALASRPDELQPGDKSSIAWACDRLGVGTVVPVEVRRFVDGLPFRVEQRALCPLQLTVGQLAGEVALAREAILLNGRSVPESRLTAWQHTSGKPFEYSGKSMEAREFSPTVDRVRHALAELVSVDFDGCLINYYRDGGTGMRYHSDPDQGVLWTTDTAVVSVGATRQFCLRRVAQHRDRHSFFVSSGDVVVMQGNCQAEYQHCVKVEDCAEDVGPRVSLVFKKSL